MFALCCVPIQLLSQNRIVLRLDSQEGFGAPLAADRGAAGLRQRLLELGTTASVLHTTAHPDDEQSGLLTLLSRGTGTRTALLSLNRGEGGANAAGDELFDALGLVRTEELLLAGRYYGLDDVYFTAAIDYGFSKTLDEAVRSWDTTAVLSDMVRVIRQDQPLVVISRWYGAQRDGHGHHQLAGVLTPLAVAAAADPKRFPEQLSVEGLTPWRVLRTFRANLRSTERADVTLDAKRYDPWLGETYESFAADGLSRQRSQTGGRRSTAVEPALQRLLQLTGTPVTSADDLLSGIDTALPALFALTGEVEPPGAVDALREVDASVRRAQATFAPDAPWSVTPLLVAGLRGIRQAQRMTQAGAPHAAHILAVKEHQFERAIVAALALDVNALAGPTDSDGSPAVPGQTITVQLTVGHESPVAVVLDHVEWLTPRPWPTPPLLPVGESLAQGTPWRRSVNMTVPTSAQPDRPYFYRRQISENRYRWRDGAPDHAPRTAPPLRARVVLRVAGQLVTVERVVRIRRTEGSEGVRFPQLSVVPPVSLRVLPAVQIVKDTGSATVLVLVEVTGNVLDGVTATVGLNLSGPGPVAVPTREVHVSLGERHTVDFMVSIPRAAGSLLAEAFARVGATEWREQVTTIQHRELEATYLYAAPTSLVRRVPVTLAAGLKVGYVMGVGDLVPEAIAQLGAEVTLLDDAAVASGIFSRFDAIVVGVRAYAVRSELPAATSALTAYARRGGNVVVLYQTQEFVPVTMAPFAAVLPDNAEETTEEHSAVTLLEPNHRLLSFPNHIGSADFEGWIEQRGSKFFSRWAAEYTALVETHDIGQQPQRGLWVSARVGDGQWTYVALALHRQLLYGVVGAYRILANLLTRPSWK
ncbi:MAG: PIG-L family deacetylase [Gemmatimonadaceae bacterium]|nr:PIG-L family deacetylase [Gemmatimonadaceae bacterium]